MPTLMAMILASLGPALVHRILPPDIPFAIKAFLDLFLWIFVFYFVYRVLTNLRPDIDD